MTGRSKLLYTKFMKADQDRAELANFFNLNIKPKPLSNDQLQQMGATAEKEREELLDKRPELRKFQEKIDRIMENAGSFEKRMAVLGIMMKANLKELQNRLTALSNQMENWKKTINQVNQHSNN